MNNSINPMTKPDGYYVVSNGDGTEPRAVEITTGAAERRSMRVFPYDNGMFPVQVQCELLRARSAHNPMKSVEEGYAVLLKQVEDFWDEVKRKPANPASPAFRDRVRMYARLIQVAAMAQRIAEDVLVGNHPAP
jgi:hypothetical protein